jgi:hypothetical protein
MEDKFPPSSKSSEGETTGPNLVDDISKHPENDSEQGLTQDNAGDTL